MSDRTSLVAAITASRDDDLPKLVFADWLEENGEPDRAEFVRLSVACHREASALPPVFDPVKAARIGELFIAHHRDWLGPVYAALGESLPALEDAPNTPVRPGFRDARAPSWQVSSLGGVVVTHMHERAVQVVSIHAGLVGMLILNADRLSPDAAFAPAMAVEPLEVMNVSFPADLGVWRRFDGPHLARVRTLTPRFDGTGDFGPLAKAFCECEHLSGLTELTVTAELANGHPPGSVLFDTLRSSPLRRQFTGLNLYDLPGAAHLLGRSDHGFDSLRELIVSTRARPAITGDLYANGVSVWLRERLTRLVIDTSRNHGLAWLTAGNPWERLETLFLNGDGVGDAGAAALAGTTALPALQQLRLIRVGITDTGATALARSPLVNRLNALFLDGNPIGDTGARELASALDCGLRYLAVRPTHAISARTQGELTARYGLRVTFTYPAVV